MKIRGHYNVIARRRGRFIAVLALGYQIRKAKYGQIYHKRMVDSHSLDTDYTTEY